MQYLVGKQSFQELTTGLHSTAQLALGGSHLLALRQDGSLAVMGTNEHGCLGLGSDSDAASTAAPCRLPDVSFQQA